MQMQMSRHVGSRRRMRRDREEEDDFGFEYSIILRGPMHCLIMSSRKYLRLRGLGCETLWGSID